MPRVIGNVWTFTNNPATPPVVVSAVHANSIYHGMGAVKHHRRRHGYAFAMAMLILGFLFEPR